MSKYLVIEEDEDAIGPEGVEVEAADPLAAAEFWLVADVNQDSPNDWELVGPRTVQIRTTPDGPILARYKLKPRVEVDVVTL